MESLRDKISRVTRHREVPTFCELYLLELAHDLTVNIGENPPCASHRGRGRQPFLNTSEPSVLFFFFFWWKVYHFISLILIFQTHL